MYWKRVDIPPSPTGADKPFGTHVMLDIYGCDVAAISSRDALDAWVTGLVEALGMKAYGEPRIPHFGHADPVTSGYSVDQLIETSNIMAHLSPHLGHAYVDIFSCSDFDPRSAADFTVKHLGGTHGRMIVIER